MMYDNWAIYQTLPLGSKSSIFDQIWSIYLIWRFHFYLKYKEKRAALDIFCKDNNKSINTANEVYFVNSFRYITIISTMSSVNAIDYFDSEIPLHQ